MLVVNPKAMPAQNFAEFLRLLKANPNKYFFASTGIGTSAHLSGELLKSMTGVEVTHVPYKGAVALNDLLSGEQVHFMFATIPSVIQHVRSGRLRGIAVTSVDALGVLARAPHDRGARLSRFRGVVLVRPARPGRHAPRDRA